MLTGAAPVLHELLYGESNTQQPPDITPSLDTNLKDWLKVGAEKFLKAGVPVCLQTSNTPNYLDMLVLINKNK